MPSPRPLVPSSGASMAATQLTATKPPQPPVTIDLTTFQQLQQQLHTQQHRVPAMPLSASNSNSASVTLSQPLSGWTGAGGEAQVSNNIQTLVQSFNRHTGQSAPSFAQSVSFSAPSPPPQLHSLLQQPNNHSLGSSSNADRPPSEVSYSALYYPQSPPASALHTLSSQFHQPASPLLSSTTYWPIQYDPNSGQQQQYVLKMNGSNIVIPAPMAVAAQQQPAQLVKQESSTSSIEHSQQAVVTPGRHSACAVCHSAKTSCNGQRPCDRCIRLDRQSMCVDRPRKTPVRSDKKKAKKEEGEQEKEADKGKKVKREHDNGAEDAGSKRVKGEDGVEEESGKASDVVKKEPSYLAPPATAATLDSPTAIRRDVSSHSSHSSSDSASSATPSSPASTTHELIDVATSTLSSEPERRLSTTYLRMHQVYPTRGAIADAIRNGAVTPLQVHFLLSYLSAVLHTDDFKQLLQPMQSAPSSSFVSPNRPVSSNALPSDLVSDRGIYTPRFHFNFGCSPLEPVDDNTEGLIDFATLQIVRVDPADIKNSLDSTVGGATGFGVVESSNNRTKPSSPAPPAVPFAASSTSAFTAVPSTTASATSTPLPSPTSSMSSSLSPATASSHIATHSSPLSPSSLGNTSSTVTEESPPTDPSTSSPSSASFSSDSSSSSSSSSTLTSSSSSFSSTSSSTASSSSDTSTSLGPLSSPSSTSSTTSAGSELFLTIRVNREFERLFGYSQPYMRDLFRSEGGKVLYRLLTAPSMPVLSKWLTEALIGERTEFKAVVTIVNRYKGTTECLLNCRWTLDSGGLFKSVAYCFSPLPEKATTSGQWMKE